MILERGVNLQPWQSQEVENVVIFHDCSELPIQQMSSVCLPVFSNIVQNAFAPPPSF